MSDEQLLAAGLESPAVAACVVYGDIGSVLRHARAEHGLREHPADHSGEGHRLQPSPLVGNGSGLAVLEFLSEFLDFLEGLRLRLQHFFQERVEIVF